MYFKIKLLRDAFGVAENLGEFVTLGETFPTGVRDGSGVAVGRNVADGRGVVVGLGERVGRGVGETFTHAKLVLKFLFEQEKELDPPLEGVWPKELSHLRRDVKI